MVESNYSANEANSFSVSLLAFWVKGSMSVDANFLHIDMPNTVLFGLIPAGKKRENTPMQGVSQVETNSSFKLGAMFFGILIAFFGVASLGSSALTGLVLTLIGVLMFLSGIKTQMSFERNGVRESIDVPFFEAEKIRAFADDVTKNLGTYQTDRNTRIQNAVQTAQLNQQSVANTQAIVNAMQGQQAPQQAVNPATQTQVQPQAANNAAASANSFCPNCGAQNPADASFCTSCGTKLN